MSPIMAKKIPNVQVYNQECGIGHAKTSIVIPMGLNFRLNVHPMWYNHVKNSPRHSVPLTLESKSNLCILI